MTTVVIDGIVASNGYIGQEDETQVPAPPPDYSATWTSTTGNTLTQFAISVGQYYLYDVRGGGGE
jgi:hypothetical protein